MCAAPGKIYTNARIALLRGNSSRDPHVLRRNGTNFATLCRLWKMQEAPVVTFTSFPWKEKKSSNFKKG
ncbi:hypothetical protein POVWA2_010160 [Plasmodium ovale wallikeri]|uniref:Uncharacterized protein n=1 Tax=Plasmodium ovale wallikeri TaxID=864142 RepID=A0A1A8YME8_PLAOA|nr:hypothetical protein POVWA2_010160 [Plasmodium ovale wallikeri]